MRVSAKLSNSSIFISISLEDFFDWRIQTPLEISVKAVFIITLSAFCSTARSSQHALIGEDKACYSFSSPFAPTRYIVPMISAIAPKGSSK